MTYLNLANISVETLRSMLAYMPSDEAVLIREELTRREPTDCEGNVIGWCETCGNSVENNVCGCWTHVAGVLERFMGYDFDRAANDAAEMWESLTIEEKNRVWQAEYADTHDVETFPRPTPKLDALMAEAWPTDDTFLGASPLRRKVDTFRMSDYKAWCEDAVYGASSPFRHDRGCDPNVNNCACSGTAPDCSVTCNCDPDR